MDVIIVSKTRMLNACCVGALSISGRSLRLLDETGQNQPLNTNIEVRQVWEINFKEKPNLTPPHIEDVLVTYQRLKDPLKSDLTMFQMVERYNAPIWRGNPDVLFDELLQWTDNGSGYISEEGEVPQHSVGFWVPDRNLTMSTVFDKTRYSYPNINGWRSLPYVGFVNPVDIIPSGTLVRISLARWWVRNGETEKRCFLQLSGWYDL